MKEANDANHWLFQLANTFLFLSYASRDVLMLRIVLMLAGLCFVLWGGIVPIKIAVDTVLWNGIFCVINAVRAAELMWQRRPIKFVREEHEEVYEKVFGPVGIGRLQFKLLMEQGLMRSLREGSTFIEAGNEATNLTLIYSGRMCILSSPKDGRPSERVGSVGRMQFVESPQWANMQVQRRKKASESPSVRSTKSGSRIQTSAAFGSSIGNSEQEHHHRADDAETLETTSTSRTIGSRTRSAIVKLTGRQIIRERIVGDEEKSTDEDEVLGMDVALDDDVREASAVDVTFKAETDCTFFTWPMERLVDYLAKTPSVSAPLNSVVGADVATKLFSQAKAGESDVVLDRRIYLPLDEPRQEAVVPVDDDENDHMDREGNDGDEEESKTMDADTGLMQRKPLHGNRNSLLAEKRWLERRGVEDTAHDRKLAAILRYRTSLNKYEISALLSKGRWGNIAREGTVLIREGEPTTFLCMVLRGTLSVHKGEGDKKCQLHQIFPEQMVGSLELLEVEREHLAGETVTALEPCTYICWDVDDLRALLAPRPRLRAQLTTLIAIDLAAKFRQVEERV